MTALCVNPCQAESIHIRSIAALAERIQPGLSQHFTFELTADLVEKFEISTVDKKTAIRGSTPNSITAGLGWYLKYHCNSGTFWTVKRNPIPIPLPTVAQTIVRQTSMKHRYYMNYCVDKYNYRYWDWTRWEQEIDWMALNGVNIGLVIIDRGAVLHKVVESYGVNETVNRYYGDAIMPPAQFHFQLHEYERAQLDRRIRLQQDVIARMRELGIQPLLDGFKGIAPRQLADTLKDVRFKDGGEWGGEPKEPFIEATDPFFEEFGAKYYQQQKKLYGDQCFIAADPVVEGSAPQTDIGELGLKIQNQILEAYPNAIWVLQGWQANPRDGLLRKTNPQRTLILDLWCEQRPQWRKRDIYAGTPWVWSIINNFGGRTGMYGNLDNIFVQQIESKSQPQGKFLCGVGALLEGLENNPVVYNALFESAWMDTKPDMRLWLRDYAKSRYGKSNKHIEKAWEILYEKVYSASITNAQQGPTENIMCARPKLKIDRVSSWGTAIPYFTNKDLIPAWDEMLSAAEELGDSDGYQLDLAELTREILSNYAWELYPKVIAAHQQGNQKEFGILAEQFLELFDEMEMVLSTRKEFMVGPWIETHRNWGQNEKEKRYFEKAAKTFITVLGGKPFSETGKLHDYSYRAWSGIMTDLYKARFETYFRELRKATDKKSEPNIDWYDFDYKWTATPHNYALEPSGSTADACKILHSKYGKNINSDGR
ncbi:MAG: alpha-N-acetylglucosaminidase [Planctomycetaceae bacterium]|nr:alpha-N-acetylglucosaminidase [Planctomycetaceae bacterium]